MVFVPQMEGLEMYFVLLNEKLKKIKKVKISLAPYLKIKKKPTTCYHLMVKSKYCANVLTKGHCKMQLPNKQEHFYLALCWHTGYQLTL